MKRARRLWSWPGALALAVAVCWSTIAAAQTGRLSGQVKDATNGKPIKGATITAENSLAAPASFTAVSDEKGRFAVIGLRSGTWTVTVSAPSYAPVKGTTRIHTAGSNPQLNILLQRLPDAPRSVFADMDPATLQREMDRGEQAIKEARYADAIATFSAIVEKMPSLTLASVQVARAQRLDKRYDDATATLTKLLDDEPASAVARYELALVERDRGNVDAAERWLREASGSPDAPADVFCALGDLDRGRQRLDEAQGWYSRARDLAPDWGRPYVKLAQLALDRGDRELARSLAEKALAAEPDGADAPLAKQILDTLKK